MSAQVDRNPHFCTATPADRAALQAFEDEVLDRLFLLNAERAKKEAVLGRAGKKSSGKTKAKPAEEPSAQGTVAAKGRKKRSPGGQGSLGWD